MSATITAVDARSPAERALLRPGESLLTINGSPVQDVLDYQYHTYDAHLTLEVADRDGSTRTVKVRKEEGEPLGLEFETYLMDKVSGCANRCIFCFVDQLPPGLRKPLYFKDDDARLSFLTGSYITLTNLTEREISRIIALRISPLYISVHASDPQLRAMLLGNPRGAQGLELMRRFADAGIEMHCQIVACPGINDGEHLRETMQALYALHPKVPSVSVVPVGLTKHREGLHPLLPYGQAQAEETVALVEAFGETCRRKCGSRVFFCSDELYLRAGRQLPDDAFYEGYPQLENGVGILRLLSEEFLLALEDWDGTAPPKPFSIATGVSAAPFLEELIRRAGDAVQKACRGVYPIENRFFGQSVDVAGLVTGGDLIGQLSGKDLGKRLLHPGTMLRHGGDVFLDDVTPEQVSNALGVALVPVAQDGGALLEAIFSQS